MHSLCIIHVSRIAIVSGAGAKTIKSQLVYADASGVHKGPLSERLREVANAVTQARLAIIVSNCV